MSVPGPPMGLESFVLANGAQYISLSSACLACPVPFLGAGGGGAAGGGLFASLLRRSSAGADGVSEERIAFS